jgi:hypothetical protein
MNRQKSKTTCPTCGKPYREVTFEQAISNRPHTIKTPAFEDMHSLGAAAWGWNWLAMNKTIVRAAERLGVDVTQPGVRRLLTQIAAEVLEVWEVKKPDEAENSVPKGSNKRKENPS